MENRKISVLLIEDSIDDAELIRRKLEKSADTRFQVTLARKLEDGLEQVANIEPDLILSDLGLPDSHGLDTVTKILLAVPYIPLVVLSGFDDEDIAIKAVQSGAQDYLVKGRMDISQLERSIYYSIERARLQHELEHNSQEISRLHGNLLKILENSTDAIVVVSEDGHIQFTNPAVEKLFGRKQKELVNQPFQFPIVTGKTSEIEIEQAGDKTTIAEMSVVKISWEGAPANLVTMHDITKRKRMENALRISEEKFSKAFMNSPEAIVISDIDNSTIIDANETFLNFSGYTREEVIGKKANELHIWAIPEERIETIRILKEKGTVRNRECHFRVKSGETRIWLFSAEIINIENKSRMLSVNADITDLKKAEEALANESIRRRILIEQSSDGIVILDQDGKVYEANQRFADMLGYSQEELSQLHVWDWAVGSTPERTVEMMRDVDETGDHFETKHRRKDGTIYDVEISTNGAMFAGQKLVFCVCRDITERNRADEALKQSEAKYRELINTSTDAIISADQQMRVTIWNHGAEKMFGYTEKEILGQPVLKIVPQKTRKSMAEGYSKFNKTGSSDIGDRILEDVGVRKDGTEVPIELSMSTRKAGDKYIATAIIRDITVRKEAEEKLRKVDEMKSEFLSNVSHELRTPLQSISGFTKLIMTGKVPDPTIQQEFLQIIDRETMHLGNLINSLLDISRLEAGRFLIYKKLVPIHDIFTDSIKMFHSLAREKKITLNVNIPAKLPNMEVDSERMHQVVINLLSNAIKFSDPGSSINAKASIQDNRLLFQVIDHGTGIRKEAMAHLFERFYRAEGETVRGGTGLGLYISKQIIEAHNGQIWAESKYGEGSTFSFSLPFNGKGGNKNGKEDPSNRRRSGNSKTGRLLTKAGGV